MKFENIIQLIIFIENVTELSCLPIRAAQGYAEGRLADWSGCGKIELYSAGYHADAVWSLPPVPRLTELRDFRRGSRISSSISLPDSLDNSHSTDLLAMSSTGC